MESTIYLSHLRVIQFLFNIHIQTHARRRHWVPDIDIHLNGRTPFAPVSAALSAQRCIAAHALGAIKGTHFALANRMSAPKGPAIRGSSRITVGGRNVISRIGGA